MSERKAELRQLSSELREHEAIADAFPARSFADRLVIVDVGDEPADTDATVPDGVVDRLGDHDLRAAEEVYGDDGGSTFAGDIGDATRHHFVDVRQEDSRQFEG
ncbi:hypothetical protein ACFQAS_08330 [Halopenitus salinus]|uniref:Uncharacterized protein n=1 Tax=Halopenitus salinus TaxID=1198295 RepID=A0ABD5UUM2_9EURY